MVCAGIMRSYVRVLEWRVQGNAAIPRDVNTDEGPDFRERAACRLLRFLTGCRRAGIMGRNVLKHEGASPTVLRAAVQVRNPNISRMFGRAEKELAGCERQPDRCDFEIDRKSPTRCMQMLNGQSRTFRTAGDWIEVLRPDAAEAIAIGEKVQQVAGRRPGGRGSGVGNVYP